MWIALDYQCLCARIQFGYYWTTPNSQNEIDFLVQMGLDTVPIEVKAETNLQAKSLKAFCKKFHCASAIRTSMAPWCVQDMPLDTEVGSCKLINLPLYAVSQIMKLDRWGCIECRINNKHFVYRLRGERKTTWENLRWFCISVQR